ncbi:CoA transferase [Frankia sp. ACN1ag]|uniref:CoA transferase n=1 Tax=Frankia sp. ACN1ag TaxID=102891 RepID=UPI0006DD14BA|nr:CoA transferase [Frankia sp. ACN1ag]KQC37116.1 formyl-CoA transferase [Frankia sp. ACN1ag]
MSGAYDGVRVLDASGGIAGAMAAMYLADQGADVVRLLSPGRGPLDGGPGALCWDRNKWLCALDRTTPAGAAQLRRLLAAADVLVVDGTPDDLDRDGLDPDGVRAAHPDLIHLWLPLLAPAAPWGRLPADPLLADAVSSASGEHGSYDGHPLALVTPIAAYGQAILGATAAAAALLGRDGAGRGDAARGGAGRGRAVLVSGLHATAAMQAASLTDAEGIIRASQPGGGGSSPNYRLYRCSDDRWLYLGALTEPLFLTALDVLDLFEVLTMPGVDGSMLNMLRPGVGAPVVERFAARFAERPLAHWERLLTDAGVPNAPAQTRDEWWAGEVVASNGMRRVHVHPELGPVEIPGDPIRLSRTPGTFSHLPGAQAFVDAAAVWTDPRPAAGGEEPAAAVAGEPAAPLAGLRVLDLGSFVAGPFGSTLLADYGAEVIKVEGPGGDPYRIYTVSFLAFHKGQDDIVVDLKTPEGRETFHDLVRSADVLLDNVRPGVRERIGTDHATLAAINPRLVRGTVTAWGTGNPLSATPAFDPLLQARSGLITAQGGAGAPCQSAMLVHDIGTGSLVAFGILAALYARRRDGLGQEVVTTMVNSSVMMQAGEFVRHAGRPAPAVGGHEYVGDTAVHRLHPCKEGWVAVAATTPEHAAALVAALDLADVGREAGVGGEAGAVALLRAPAAGPAADRITAALAGLTSAEAADLLAAAGVPAAPVLDRGGFLTDPWFAAAGILTRIDEPDVGPCTVVRRYADWSGNPVEITAAAPPPGAGTRRILAGLGYSDSRIAELLAAGAVREHPAP